jgi:DNA-binding MarR family transcriptional regulator
MEARAPDASLVETLYVAGPLPRGLRWTLVTNHALVLVCVARSHDMRVRDIAKAVGITERSTQMILSDLEAEGFIERVRVGRRNHYRVITTARLRHRLVADTTLADLLDALNASAPLRASRPRLVI